MNEFIKTQQELAREEVFNQWPYTAEFNKELMYPWIDTLIQKVITNTGEELLRRVEGERKDEVKWKKAKYDVKSVEAVCYNRGIDTIKQHITNVTGVE